ncbi:MAG TPA: helix-turn-helix domain-containing protein [Candidatus Dormibacteraeota bacterium]
MAAAGLDLARRLRRDAAREQILDAAWELATRRSLHGLSMRALAGMLRIDHQRIYTHFRSKHDLYLALSARRFPASREEWEAVGVHDDDGAPQAPRLLESVAAGSRGAEAPQRWARPPMTAIDAIDRCTVVAERCGHVLGGFVRRSHSVSFRFTARCRVCGDEMSVRRTPGGWVHTTEAASCRS